MTASLPQPMICLIAAVGRNAGIGKNNGLLWHLPGDLQHFKRTTLHSPIIMGRKTWDSIGRPLPQRHNIVITRDTDKHIPGVSTVGTWEQALEVAGNVPAVYVIGGAQIYGLALPHAHQLILTEVDDAPEADTFFPSWDRTAWVPTDRQEQPGTEPRFAFVTYRKKTH